MCAERFTKNQRKLDDIIAELKDQSGSGTSMITLAIPAGASLAPTSQLLTKEAGTATNIKCRV